MEKQMQQAKENAKLALYQNPSYQFERREKKTLILDVSSPGGAAGMLTNFNVKLLEPLRIDRLSDVYLDSFITFKAQSNAAIQRIGFTLKINEFNINSNVASNQDKSGGYDSTKFNSIFIANNDNTEVESEDTFLRPGSGKFFSHKAKKFNYIAYVNACTLSTLSGELLDAGTIVNGGSPVYESPLGLNVNSDGSAIDVAPRFMAEFIIVAID